ncbi:ferritin-like domain-containing protein [Actinomadura kijaniata]|uniref:ferritin-like domain-containing protein n=1 Tax=Actinomadura kijaniata TaxID=46161 RepID=UPI0008341937|nr:ferritin-like domain-containing protein [Actinomadura kijaniata]
MGFDATAWRRHFEDEAERRRATPDPDWDAGARLTPELVRSLQRFQVGENGDGANLIRKAGDGDYGVAARLFVAEEQNHARMLALLLGAAGEPTIGAHWSDALFVRLRRALGLRTELAVLMIAEVVALRYYRALRDGAADPLARDVAARVLADERRHVPFHCARLNPLPRPLALLWLCAVAAVSAVVVADHGWALRELGMTRRTFVRDVFAEARAITRLMTDEAPAPREPAVR